MFLLSSPPPAPPLLLPWGGGMAQLEILGVIYSVGDTHVQPLTLWYDIVIYEVYTQELNNSFKICKNKQTKKPNSCFK